MAQFTVGIYDVGKKPMSSAGSFHREQCDVFVKRLRRECSQGKLAY